MEAVEKKKVTKKAEETKQPTVEELKNYCAQLLQQRNQLAQQIQQLTGVLNKLPWLFKVVENESYFTMDTVDKAVQEITEILFPVVEDQSEETEEPTEE